MVFMCMVMSNNLWNVLLFSYLHIVGVHTNYMIYDNNISTMWQLIVFCMDFVESSRLRET